MQLKCDYDLKITDLFGVAVSEDRIVVELFCSVDERTSHGDAVDDDEFYSIPPFPRRDADA